MTPSLLVVIRDFVAGAGLCASVMPPFAALTPTMLYMHWLAPSFRPE